MSASLRIAKIWGVPIGLHWSWFIVFALVTFSLAASVFPSDYAGLSGAAYWTLGALTSVLFFASVLLHELGHTALARRFGVPVREINLFIFGGVAILTRESPSAKAEFWIAIAGPLVSLALAAVFGAVWFLSGDFVYLAAPAYWLAWINFSLAVFNMIPGFPLDGGRVFRAIVWHVKGNLHRATEIASGVGQFVAFGFMACGAFMMFGGNLFGGLWIIFIGWFLQNAAAATLAQSNLEQNLRDVTVGDVMSANYPRAAASASLETLINERILRGESRYFIVHGDEADAPQGIITLKEIAQIPRETWSRVTIGRAMIPNGFLRIIAPHAKLFDALRRMDEAGVAQMPVVENGRLVGVLSREQILHHINLRAELGIDRETAKREMKLKPVAA